METVAQNAIADPSYNSYVIAEPDDMSAALDQYWIQRKASRVEAVERLEALAENNEAGRVWEMYCRQRLGFLTRLIRTGAEAFEQALLTELHWNRGFARDARSLFQRDARLEIRIPLGHNLSRVVRVPGVHTSYDVVEYGGYDTVSEPGKPVIAVNWKGRDLALLLPSLEFVELDTFVVNVDKASWNTADILPRAFLSVLPEVSGDLHAAEHAFAALRRTWEAADQLALARKQLEGIDRSSELWGRVHIPEHQKVELLRRLELFEDSDPAAPRGLLLKGPSGTGKTWIARTIAETLNCHIQILSLPDFKRPNLGDSAQEVRAKWNESRSHQPSIMFVDDCEGVLTRRGANQADKISEEIVESFLPEWDGARERSRILLIGATNRPDLLDDAIVSRFGWVVEIQLPDSENRSEIFAQEVRALGVTARPTADIGALTQGMSGRDLLNLAAALCSDRASNDPTEEEIRKAVTSIRRLRNSSVDEQFTWENLILEDAILERLKILCALLKRADDWSAHGVSVPKGLLMIGEPGTGKERAARTLAREGGLNFLAPTIAQLKATILGGSANAVQQLFERGRSMAPVVIFLNNLAKLTPKQSSYEHRDRLSEEIASQIQQEMNSSPNASGRVFLIGTTRNADLVDEDVLSCFDEQIEVPLPNAQLRVRLLAALLRGKKLGFLLADGVLTLSKRFNDSNSSAGDLARYVQAAEQRALTRAIRDGGPEHLRIDLEDFEILYDSQT
ncbi:AAA family ATPase [Acidicapsa dinghuensis]|uniref:AAA family ATPase n=1 Tax=Acidicapsa dinghuensis TaxID=2218256 RepID=A0ABW1ECM7_9BACT|nr:AAA family ATPase [Acidicapsa dinghuensis]